MNTFAIKLENYSFSLVAVKLENYSCTFQGPDRQTVEVKSESYTNMVAASIIRVHCCFEVFFKQHLFSMTLSLSRGHEKQHHEEVQHRHHETERRHLRISWSIQSSTRSPCLNLRGELTLSNTIQPQSFGPRLSGCFLGVVPHRMKCMSLFSMPFRSPQVGAGGIGGTLAACGLPVERHARGAAGGSPGELGRGPDDGRLKGLACGLRFGSKRSLNVFVCLLFFTIIVVCLSF